MPPPDSDLSSQAAANNSSDFVRKLYKMLEDPTYKSVVRWGNDGNSFVVLENEKFTKTILPKHFKHSNFASFVRQLNKYDFHKVRHNDESGQTAYGQGAWEFKHPEFRQHKKDNLDNIRRKAPATRKITTSEEPFPATQQIVLNDSLTATQHQVQALQEQFTQMAQTNKVLLDELYNMKKLVKAQHQVHVELISHLNNMDEQRRRNSRIANHSNHSMHSGSGGSGGGGGGSNNGGGGGQYHAVAAVASLGMLPDSGDEPAIELRRAREILNNVSTEAVADRELERLMTLFQSAAGSSPPDSAGSASVVFNNNTNNGNSNPGAGAGAGGGSGGGGASGGGGGSGGIPLGLNDPNDMRHLVYPAGQNAGIDPFHADHINNIPYTRPLSNQNGGQEVAQLSAPPPTKDAPESLWGNQQPKILLVEDDKVCARIGAKFLTQVGCLVEVARDGSEAVNKVNQNPDHFDLIFMDIIMPVFDGVSATACIRIATTRVPIVAMTSNIRTEDVATYFHWGMNDVLAKPFTKEGMVRILKKHLMYLLKNPPPPGSVDDLSPLTGGSAQQAGYMNSATMAGMNTMQQQSTMGPMTGNAAVKYEPVKYETTPIQSPSTTGSWHSPGNPQMQQTAANLDTSGGYLSSSVNGMGPNTGSNGTSAAGVGVGGVGVGAVGGVGGVGGVGVGVGGVGPRPTYQTGPGQPTGMSIHGGDERPEKRQRLYAPGQYT